MKNKEQNNSVFARIWRSKYQTLYGAVCFLLIYLMLLYAGSKFVFLTAALGEHGKRWPSFLVVLVMGLIILASSLLGKMFHGWLRDRKNNSGDNNGM